jgi:hypothetical protein
MGIAIWDRPVGFNASLEEGRQGFRDGKLQTGHKYRESAGAKEWERGWKAEQDLQLRKEKARVDQETG